MSDDSLYAIRGDLVSKYFAPETVGDVAGFLERLLDLLIAEEEPDEH